MTAKYLIDVNLPRKLSVWHSNDFQFVADLDAKWSDQKIWDYAHVKKLTIVTKDADFTARVFVKPDGPHVIHLRLGNMKIRALHAFLTSNWASLCALSSQHQLVTVFEDHIDCVT